REERQDGVRRHAEGKSMHLSLKQIPGHGKGLRTKPLKRPGLQDTGVRRTAPRRNCRPVFAADGLGWTCAHYQNASKVVRGAPSGIRPNSRHLAFRDNSKAIKVKEYDFYSPESPKKHRC